MKSLFLILLPSLSLAATIPPTPLPIFLRSGFSSILEFTEPPTRVVLGSSENFKVEKLDHSLVIKTLVPYASTNMFVYFKAQEPRLFLLKASEDAEPTYYRKLEAPMTAQQAAPAPASVATPVKSSRSLAKRIATKRQLRVTSAIFDSKKDYLTVDLELRADGNALLKPHWEWVRLSFNETSMAPTKLWSERQEVQKDSMVKARFIFAKPNVPRDLNGVSLVIPVLDNPQAMSVRLKGVSR